MAMQVIPIEVAAVLPYESVKVQRVRSALARFGLAKVVDQYQRAGAEELAQAKLRCTGLLDPDPAPAEAAYDQENVGERWDGLV